MTRAARLTFRPDALGREQVLLGQVPIGAIIPWNVPKARACYTAQLHDQAVVMRPAPSFHIARIRVERLVSEWAQRLGWLDPGARVEVVVEDPERKRA